MDLSEISRRFTRNAQIILGSRLAFGLVNLATNALVVRAYGLHELGIVVLLQAYARLFTEIAKFESWQAVLSYGAMRFDSDPRSLRRLLGLTLSIDILSVLAGIAAGIVLIPWAARTFEWPPEVASFAPVFLISIAFITQGTLNGVLRLTDRVEVLAWQHGCNALVRLAGVLVAWGIGAGVMGIVLAWFAGSVVSGLLQYGMALAELARRRLKPKMHWNLRAAGAEFPRIWSYLAFTNAASSLGFFYNSGAAMVVGAELGASSAATVQLARQFANGLGRPVRLLGPIISPEFAKLRGAGNWTTFRALLWRVLRLSALIVGIVGALLMVVLAPLLAAIYGQEILPNIWLFRFMIMSSLVSMISFSFEPALLSAAKAGTLLAIRVVSATVFIVSGLFLLEEFGLITAGLAYLLARLVDVTLLAFLGGRLLAKRVRRAQSDLGGPE